MDLTLVQNLLIATFFCLISSGECNYYKSFQTSNKVFRDVDVRLIDFVDGV